MSDDAFEESVMAKQKKQGYGRPPLVEDETLKTIRLETGEESERGFVLLCGAIIDRALEKLLRTKLNQLSGASEKELDFLLSKRPLPPLGSASIKARVARVLGVIDEDTCKAVIKLCDFRNRFAHDEVVPPLSKALIMPLYEALSRNCQDIFASFQSSLGLDEPVKHFSPKSFLTAIAATLTVILEKAERKIIKAHPIPS